MNRLLIILPFVFFSILHQACHAQKNVKMNFGAALIAADGSNKEKNIKMLVKGSVREIKIFTEQHDGSFYYSADDIASISLQAKFLTVLADQTFVNRIETKSPYSKLQTLSDTMLIHTRVIPVHNGSGPLAQPYKGDGVVMGIIDTGIDYTHPDFKDSTGKTRIKFLWDQVLNDSVPPLPFNYGQEWNNTDIDNGKATAHLTTALTNYGHGTHVSSIAAGNGLAMNKYKGVAPNADIIFVALDFNAANGIADATKYIYDKAALLGKPCVINVSIGDYYGSHDGLNLEAQIIKNQIIAQPSRSFVAAAGNAGDLAIHAGHNVTSDTTFSWLSGSAYIGMYASTSDFSNIQFSIGADKVTPTYSFRGNTAFSGIAPHIGVLGYDTIYNGTNKMCTMITYGDLYMGVNSMEFSITPDTTTYFWRLMTTGSGKFDAWSFDLETANLADSLIYSPLKKYKQPDLKSNMASSFQCLGEVITVGNYTNRNQYFDYDTILQFDNTRVPGNLFSSSSKGPTRDGRIKPDITSPGDWTLGAIPLSMSAQSISLGNTTNLAQGGFHKLDGGTSNASPSVAGIAALYLQMQPFANWQTVKNTITNCARLDVFTSTNLPDNNWGYGKADAFNTLTGCATSNNDIYNTDNKDIIIYPNPSFGRLVIANIPSGINELIIYSLLGKKIFQSNISSENISLELNAPNGIYYCTFKKEGSVVTTKKMIVAK